MDKLLKIVLMLTAVDNMSTVVGNALKKSTTDMDRFKKQFGKGAVQFEVGKEIVNGLSPAIKAYANLEESATRLQTLMMDANGNVGDSFKDVNALAIELGNQLPGTTADFQNLFSVMIKNGLDAQNILSGTGKAAAYLAVNLKMPTDQIGEFAARMKIAAGIADNEMMPFMDQLNRFDQIGIKADEMGYAFQRSAGTLKLLGLQGLESSKKMGVLFAELIRNTGSGERTGTGFTTLMQDMLDPKKYTAMKEAAARAGITDFKMFDKGKFLGVDNMIEQFNKLQKLSMGTQAGIAKALTGGGNDDQLMLMLINGGTKAYQGLNAEAQKHASLNTQVTKQLTTLNQIWEATIGTVENMLAAFGAGLAPELKAIAGLFGTVAGWVQQFLSHNPAFAKFIGMTVAAIGIFVMAVGVINMVKGAFMALRLVMLANPFILIATIAIAVIALIYANWDKISAFFKRLWESVKSIFKAAWEWVKNMFLSYTPYGLVIKHWDKISAFFSELWENVKKIFFSMIEWLLGLGSRFVEAGKNIVLSIWNGIKAMAHLPVEAIKGIVKKIRDYLPFSPAKTGALKDIHKIRLIETIAGGMKAEPLLREVDNITRKLRDAMGFNVGNVPGFTRTNNGFVPSFVLAGGGTANAGNVSSVQNNSRGGNVNNFHFHIDGSGGDTKNIIKQLRQFAPDLLRLIDKERERQEQNKF